MDNESGLQPLLGMTIEELSLLATTLGMPSYAGRQIAKWIYQKRARTIAEMTDLSKEHRKRLESLYCVGIIPYMEASRSEDGTVKYLFPTRDGKCVETVFIPDRDRATLCVSSQVGCKMCCVFCQTGRQGFEGNLSVADILNQIYALPEAEQLTNIVFMGQGEPLDNFDNVLRATALLQAPYGLAWSPKRITVSTVGVRNKLQRFVEESSCHLAVSLHSALPAVRERLMPAERGMSIREILALLRAYDFSHQRRLTFEYTMFRGVNDSLSDAKAIVALLRGLNCRVNLIRFHEIEGIDLKCSEERSIEMMNNFLNLHGIPTTTRTSRGQDIYAACGLLTTAARRKQKINNDNE